MNETQATMNILGKIAFHTTITACSVNCNTLSRYFETNLGVSLCLPLLCMHALGIWHMCVCVYAFVFRLIFDECEEVLHDRFLSPILLHSVLELVRLVGHHLNSAFAMTVVVLSDGTGHPIVHNVRNHSENEKRQRRRR